MVPGALWVLLALVLVVGLWSLLRANRLDRLHVRTDAAAAGLRAALDRRAVVARTIAAGLDAAGFDAGRGAAVRAAASAAEKAPMAEREAAENELTLALGRLTDLPPALAEELSDAQQRVMIARRVHNDAVRDTLALRGTRLARWLRLAGTAQAPTYFEITETTTAGPGGERLRSHVAAHVVLLDEAGRVLLLEGADPARPHEPFWFTAGGGVRNGENPRATAVRELREETGLRLAAEDLVGPVWWRDVLFSFDGAPLSAREWFFVARSSSGAVPGGDPRRHWWSAEELGRTDAVVHPAQLAELLPTAAIAAAGWDGVTRPIR